MRVEKIHDTQTTCKIQTRNVLDLHVQNNTFIKGNGGEGKQGEI